VLSALVRLCEGDVATAIATLGLGPTQADDVRRNARLREVPTAAAERVYSGVLYDALGLSDLDASAHRRALARVAVVSSLYGLVRPGERIVDLRSSTYAAFWRPAPDLAPRVVTVRVLHEVNGNRQIVSHFNKATKGRLVRALLTDGRDPRTPRAFAALLTDLGWVVEVGTPSATGTPLDVVVSEL
jgi:cytoplasmic iron level regulating protein YaaA (DUF328/UPF0246 family)